MQIYQLLRHFSRFWRQKSPVVIQYDEFLLFGNENNYNRPPLYDPYFVVYFRDKIFTYCRKNDDQFICIEIGFGQVLQNLTGFEQKGCQMSIGDEEIKNLGFQLQVTFSSHNTWW